MKDKKMILVLLCICLSIIILFGAITYDNLFGQIIISYNINKIENIGFINSYNGQEKIYVSEDKKVEVINKVKKISFNKRPKIFVHNSASPIALFIEYKDKTTIKTEGYYLQKYYFNEDTNSDELTKSYLIRDCHMKISSLYFEYFPIELHD